MAKAKEVIRIFKISDAENVQSSRVFFNQFQKDKEKFVQLDPDLGDNFSTSWLAAILEAESFAGDEAIQNQLKILTEGVKAEMDTGRAHFQKMKYHIEKAFPDNQAIWNAFGYSNYDSVRNS